jgi:hypothetical protein
MAEVERGKVEEIDNEENLGEDEVSTDEKHHECKLKEVIEDKVASNSSSCLYVGGVGREQVPHVSDLEEKNDNPAGIVNNVGVYDIRLGKHTSKSM